MNVETLHLENFRNYRSSTLTFYQRGIHCLYGQNAQGKTNVLEALYCLSYIQSFRTRSSQALIRQGEMFYRLQAKITSRNQKKDLCMIGQGNKKHLFLFQDPVSKYSQFVGVLNAILFCPDDMDLFRNAPRLRRRFMDLEMVKLSKSYTSTLSHYQAVLKERNQALKQSKVDRILVDTYTSQLIQDQKTIIEQRSRFAKRLEDHAKALYPFFSKEKESLRIEYSTFVDVDQDLIKQLEHAYDQSYLKDLQYKQTTIGIHRDDLLFKLGNHLLTEVASQGQKRSVLLAVKLALCQMIYEKTYEYPILLLDDVFSELDANRQRQFVMHLPKDMQIFITSTYPIEMRDRDVYLYQVNQGEIKEVSR